MMEAAKDIEGVETPAGRRASGDEPNTQAEPATPAGPFDAPSPAAPEAAAEPQVEPEAPSAEPIGEESVHEPTPVLPIAAATGGEPLAPGEGPDTSEAPGDGASQPEPTALLTLVGAPATEATADGEPEVHANPWHYVPLAPKTVTGTGVPEPFLRELLLKVLWAYDKPMLSSLVDVSGLHSRVVDELVEGLTREGLAEIDTGMAQTKAQYRFRLTDRGKNAAHEALDRSRYVGVAPVPVGAYNKIVDEQIRRFKRPPLDEVREALKHLVLPERLVEILGQAFFSRRALMVYGPSGNGKTDIVTSIAGVVAGTVIIPYALYGHGQLIRVFDPDVHRSQVEGQPQPIIKDGDSDELFAGEALRRDRRWLPVSRPTVVVGGDMGAEALDMTYDATQGIHNAPLSIVAQGGVLVIDDLGRQKISPKEILNRWVIMMEQGYDSFALGSSEIVRLPLDVTLVFSTNLTLQDLMDEAYLRRIAYKIAIPGPNKEQLLEITRRFCKSRDIEWSEDAVIHLTDRCFAPGMPEARGCHPRDIITTVIDEAEFQSRKPILDRETIDTACALYFGVGEFIEQPAA